jgi:hypothetical protein
MHHTSHLDCSMELSFGVQAKKLGMPKLQPPPSIPTYEYEVQLYRTSFPTRYSQIKARILAHDSSRGTPQLRQSCTVLFISFPLGVIHEDLKLF